MLVYVGDGAALIDIPARDIPDAELAELAARFGVESTDLESLLIERGLYQTSESPA